MGHRAFSLCAGPMAFRQLECQCRGEIRSLQAGDTGIGVESASRNLALCAIVEPARARVLRPHIPDSGTGKLAAGELAAGDFHRARSAAVTSATSARQLL